MRRHSVSHVHTLTNTSGAGKRFAAASLRFFFPEAFRTSFRCGRRPPRRLEEASLPLPLLRYSLRRELQ